MSDFDNLIISAFRDKNFKYAAEEEFDPASTALDILSLRLNAAIQANPTLQNQILQVFGNARKFLIGNIKIPAENFTVINAKGALSLRNTSDERVNNFYQMLLDRILDKIEPKTSAPLGTSENPLDLSKPATSTESESTNETTNPVSESLMRISVTTKLEKSDSTSERVISDETIFGREGTFKIQDPYVSRQHCKFFKDVFDSWYVQDLDSRHGTFINGRKLNRGYGFLRKGDVVRIGKTTILIKNIFDYTRSK